MSNIHHMLTRFLDFTIDLERLELRKGSGVIALEPQVFRLLALLVDNRDRVMGKDELIEQVWGGRLTSDAAVTSRIKLLRKLLPKLNVMGGCCGTDHRHVAQIAEQAA